MATRAGQKISKNSLSVREKFTKSIREKLHAGGSYETVFRLYCTDGDLSKVQSPGVAERVFGSRLNAPTNLSFDLLQKEVEKAKKKLIQTAKRKQA